MVLLDKISYLFSFWVTASGKSKELSLELAQRQSCHSWCTRGGECAPTNTSLMLHAVPMLTQLRLQFCLLWCPVGNGFFLSFMGNEERACTNHHLSMRLIFVVVFLPVGVFFRFLNKDFMKVPIWYI